MPAIKHRLDVRAPNFLALTGLNRDLVFQWQDFYLAAASLSVSSSPLSTCLTVATLSGSHLSALRFVSTSHAGGTFPVWVTHPVPQDAAISGPASGSGTVYIDWTDPTTANAVAVIAASLYLVPNGSAVSDSGTSTLATACATLTGTSASELQSTSLMSFNAPTTRAGFFALKVAVAAADAANTSGSNFHLLSARLRYKADRIGS